MKTELKDRILFYDGINQVHPDFVPDLLLMGVPIEKIAVTENNEEITTFNTISDFQIPIGDVDVKTPNLAWKLPKKYFDLNLRDYLTTVVESMFPGNDVYAARLEAELKEIEKRNLQTIAKTLVYVIDRFKDEGVVYGIGRGSSCASLALYLIGIHRVDPVKYDIPMTEFFHD